MSRGFFRFTQICFDIGDDTFNLLDYGEVEEDGKTYLAAEISSDDESFDLDLGNLQKDGDTWRWSDGTEKRVVRSKLGKAIVDFFNTHELPDELRADVRR